MATSGMLVVSFTSHIVLTCVLSDVPCRDRILSLGPTFIKIGQLFSTRTDILPAEVTEELSRLQDRVPAFSSQQAIGILERELAMPVLQAFRTFQERPIAAASLGQVSLILQDHASVP